MSKFYLTTAIPYVNGKPHIGHALEYFQADTIRRYKKLQGDNTLLLSGADENALKNVQAAEKENMPVQEFLDMSSNTWKEAYGFLGVELDIFQRGSDQEKHWPGVQKLWKLCEETGDIYKKGYEGLYCIGCEAFKSEDELVEGQCTIHQKKPEFVREENYFFRLSKYQDRLISLIESKEFKITPDNKRAEALSFIKNGLEDFSISRSKERAQGIGVPVPGDNDQRIYVWFDALNIYMTGIGFGWNEDEWSKWWPCDLHVIGKDINRFHTVYWPAMLLSAGIPLPHEILIHGFVNAKGGEKMSKSLGNVIDPYGVVEKFGLEPVRYFLLSQIPIDADGDFSIERFEEVYNADLANGLGNLAARVAKMCESVEIENGFQQELSKEYTDCMNEYRLNEALSIIWNEIRQLDKYIDQKAPWKIKDKEELSLVLSEAVQVIRKITLLLKPFLPETARKLEDQFNGTEIKSQASLFPRI